MIIVAEPRSNPPPTSASISATPLTTTPSCRLTRCWPALNRGKTTTPPFSMLKS
jgi:hypothetical protein